MTEKSDIRKEVRRRISSLSPRQRLEAANIVFDRIERSEAFARATCVALYASLPDEVPTHETIQRWAAAKRVVLPRVEGDTMRFFDYDPATMRRGSFGIDEPEAEGECTPDAIDLIIIPRPKASDWGAARAITTVICRSRGLRPTRWVWLSDARYSTVFPLRIMILRPTKWSIDNGLEISDVFSPEMKTSGAACDFYFAYKT